jgi:hypothetical protein
MNIPAVDVMKRGLRPTQSTRNAPVMALAKFQHFRLERAEHEQLSSSSVITHLETTVDCCLGTSARDANTFKNKVYIE